MHHHVAGQPVGNIMQSWRKLRADQPDLFAAQRVKVWQSPTAFVDSVIWSWQQREESSRFENLIRQVDSLRTHWSDQSQERNFLSQCIQTCVPPGCTPLGQITDTGFAQPGKAACRECHEQQRTLLRLKARQQKTAVAFKVGAGETFQAAGAMHTRFLSLNQERQTVLAEGRACGWLHFRPDESGLLQKAENEPWAASLTEGSSRMGPEFRANRDSWVQEGRVLPLSEAEMEQLKTGPREEQQETDYFKPDLLSEPLEIDVDEQAGTVEEQMQFEAALLHPAVRSQQQNLLAALVLVTSQKGKPRTPKVRETRAEKVLRWREALGSKQIEARLGELVPFKAAKGKKVKKSVLKKGLKKGFLGPASKAKLAKKNQKANQAAKEKEAKQKEEAAAAAQAGPLVGKTVVCIAASAQKFWQNGVCEVISQHPTNGQLRVRLLSTKTERDMPAVDFVEHQPAKKAGFADKVDHRRLSHLQKDQIWKLAGCAAEQTADGQLVEGPELSVSWMEVFLRGWQSGDRWAPGCVVYLEPHQTAASTAEWKSRTELSEQALQELRKSLHVAITSQEPCLVLAPIQAGGPDHWTALSFIRLPGKSFFQAAHQDSLSEVHAGCRAQAVDLHDCLRYLGLSTSQPDLPPTTLPVWQGDGWSCGWHTVSRFEELYSQFRGEGFRRSYATVSHRRQQTNRLAAAVKMACHKPAAAAGASSAAAAPAAGTSSAAAAAAAGTSSAAAAAAGASSAAAAAATAAALGPPPLPPPASEPVPLPAPGPVLAALPTGSYGCSKCRWSQAGCLSCNAEKALKYSLK